MTYSTKTGECRALWVECERVFVSITPGVPVKLQVLADHIHRRLEHRVGRPISIPIEQAHPEASRVPDTEHEWQNNTLDVYSVTPVNIKARHTGSRKSEILFCRAHSAVGWEP